MAEYKDQFTLDGKIKPLAPYVTRKKVEEADRLLSSALRGDRIASGKLAEVMTTSDLKFNLAHLITVTALPQFEEAERTWSQIAGVRTVPDFSPVRLQSIFGDLTGAGIHEDGGLVRVPEDTPYPYVSVTGVEAFYSKVSKFGAKFGFSWESRVNDVEGFFDNIPSELVSAALDTEEREVYTALKSTTTSLAGGTLPDGTVVPANAPVSVNAIAQAIYELETTEINGRQVGASSNGYNVVVPIGRKRFLDYEMSQNILAIQDGSITFSGGDRSWMGSATIIESEYLTGTEWYLLPKPGGVRRPVLELGRLRGYEAPELRVHGDTGQYIGGSAVSPFEGNFDTDAIDFRIRMVCGGILWDDSFVIKSTGAGS